MAGFKPRRTIVAAVTAAALFLSSIPVSSNAALVSTESAVAAQTAEADRSKVEAFLVREDVAQQFRALGISSDEARARVASMSDAEIRQIAGRIDDVPAGGSALGVVLGTALLIFVILLITDIAGLTKVFPWTRSVR